MDRLIEAAHLLRRTGFGPTLAEIRETATLSHEEAVKRLLSFDAAANAERFNPLTRMQASPLKPTEWSQDQLQQIWLDIMLETPSPLQEKMVLFWHNHFTSSLDKVGDAILMLEQNNYFRRHALGNFATMVSDMAINPAMLIYLDGVDNSRDNPNENFARELMELFTIGRGNYTEQDIRESARAFTGWQIDETNGGNLPARVIYNQEAHDNSLKTFMGATGDFSSNDIISIILQKRETAYFITRKFWEFFVYPEPDYALIKHIGDMFYYSGYDCRKLLELILLDPEFLSSRAYRANIKSPVEIVTGSVRALGGKKVEGFYLNAMGQALFTPRNVRGWIGGRHWINSASFLSRVNYCSQILQPDDAQPHKLPYLSSLLASGNAPTQAILDDLATLLIDNQAAGLNDIAGFLNAPWKSDSNDPDSRRQDYAGRLRGLIQLLMSCPEYQLN